MFLTKATEGEGYISEARWVGGIPDGILLVTFSSFQTRFGEIRLSRVQAEGSLAHRLLEKGLEQVLCWKGHIERVNGNPFVVLDSFVIKQGLERKHTNPVSERRHTASAPGVNDADIHQRHAHRITAEEDKLTPEQVEFLKELESDLPWRK